MLVSTVIVTGDGDGLLDLQADAGQDVVRTCSSRTRPALRPGGARVAEDQQRVLRGYRLLEAEVEARDVDDHLPGLAAALAGQRQPVGLAGAVGEHRGRDAGAQGR